MGGVCWGEGWGACLRRVNILKGDPGGVGGGSVDQGRRGASQAASRGAVFPPCSRPPRSAAPNTTQAPVIPAHSGNVWSDVDESPRGPGPSQAARPPPGSRSSPYGACVGGPAPSLPQSPALLRSVFVRFAPQRSPNCKAFVKPCYPTGITTFSRHPSRARVDGTRPHVFPSSPELPEPYRISALC